jgi:hypothetical protein
MGYASAGALADFIVVNMVAEAASGSKTPKEAAERAQKRAERYYKSRAASGNSLIPEQREGSAVRLWRYFARQMH